MAKKTLEQRLNEVLRLDDPPVPEYADMENLLNKICELLQKQIDGSGKKATVSLEPGHLVKAGQQFNVVVQIPGQNRYRDTLFRAYIPAAGTPVTLDFVGDAPEKAATPEQLEKSVIKFLSLEPIRAMLRTFREMAMKAPVVQP